MRLVTQKALASDNALCIIAFMRSHSDIVEQAGSAAIAELLGKPIFTVRSWRQRNSIPSEYWAALIEAQLANAEELIAAAAKAA